MLDESSVTPIATASETPISLEQPTLPSGETPASSESALNDEVLQIPFLQAIFAGAPPAVSFGIKAAEKTEEAKIIAKNKDSLQEAGINFYRALSGDTGVVFNSQKISGEDLIAADKAGKLLEIAPAAAKVSQDILSSGANHPALSQGAPPSGPAAPTANVPPQSASVPMPAPSTGAGGQARQKLAARLKNLQPGPPTGGSNPGAGRLLASIMKPVL